MASGKVNISKVPAAAVSGLAAPSRKVSGSKAVFSTSWGYPSACFDEKKNDRFEGVLVQWIADTNKAASTVQTKTYNLTVSDTKTSKKKRKTTTETVSKKVSLKYSTVTGIAGAKVYLQRKRGSSETAASLTLARSNFYPHVKKTTTMVKIYKAKTATWNSKTRKWVLSNVVLAGNKSLSDLNTAVKKSQVYSRASLMSFPKTKSPKNKLFYVSKTGKYAWKKYDYQPKLYGVGVRLQGWNSKTPSTTGKASTVLTAKWSFKSPVQAAYRSFGVPAAPKLSKTVAGEASGHAIKFSVDASADDGSSFYERYDTTYTLKKTSAFYSGSKLKVSASNSVVISATKTNKTFDQSRNPNVDMPTGRTLLSLKPNEYIKYVFEATNRGFAGNSKVSSSSFTYARPHDTVVKSVVKTGIHYTITFGITSGKNVRYTTKYKLQRLSNYRPSGEGTDRPVDDWTDAQWKTAAKNESSWTDVYTIGAAEVKNGTASFSDLVSNAQPDPFKRSYYRVVAENDIYGMPGMPSEPFVVGGFLRIPSSTNQNTKLLSLSSTTDGQSIMVVAAFQKTKNSSGYYNSNGTELSWDTVTYAWGSTQPPSSYDFKDDVVKPIAVTAAAKTNAKTKKYLSGVAVGWCYATYYIRGVQPEEKYYVKGRRFLKDTETREADSYGPYADYKTKNGAVASIEVAAVPTDVKLDAPERLVYGKDLSVSWTYESDNTQTEYNLLWAQGTAANAKAAAKTLISKKDSAPYAVIEWSKLSGKIFNDVIYLAVKMKTDSGWSNVSDVKSIQVARPPKASLSNIGTLTSQPLVVTLGTDNPQAAAVVRVLSNQVIDWGPEGPDNQADEAIIHTDKLFKPGWKTTTLSNGSKWYYVNYTIPVSDFRNNGTYTVEYTAVDDETGLDSDTVDNEGNVVKCSKTFSVDYSDQIAPPNFYIVADPIDPEHGGRVRVSLPDIPSNENCVADVYRVTPSGVYLLKGNITEWRNATVTDPYPPYSRNNPCTYRVCLRSNNGVREWADRSYSMPGYCVRFDWGEEESETHDEYTHLTLPYNLKWSDSWSKNARIDLHLDGTYNGYWRGGVDHKNTLSTEIVKLTGAEQVARVIALAKYAGPVLVRLPNGCTFCANVDVTNLDVSYDSLVVSASFSAQEIAMPAKYTDSVADVVSGLYVPRQ